MDSFIPLWEWDIPKKKKSSKKSREAKKEEMMIYQARLEREDIRSRREAARAQVAEMEKRERGATRRDRGGVGDGEAAEDVR